MWLFEKDKERSTCLKVMVEGGNGKLNRDGDREITQGENEFYRLLEPGLKVHGLGLGSGSDEWEGKKSIDDPHERTNGRQQLAWQWV